jgi:hypothetical protein
VLKHWLRLIVTALAFAFSLAMMGRAVGPASPWMVLLVMMCFLGLAKIAEPIYLLKMPGRLRSVRPWELKGKIYRSLRVPEFGALLRNTPLRLLNTSVYLSGEKPDVRRILRLVEAAEASHFWAGVLLTPYLFYCAWTGRWAVLGVCLIVVQVVGNIYPILHLRWTRGRLERMRRRVETDRASVA